MTADVPAHRHGEVDIIFNMSELLHLEGLAQRASPTRPLRGNLQVKSLPAPPASAMSAQRACHASALVPPDCWRPRPCASHGRPSLLRPTPPPRSRRQGHPLRVRRRGAAIVSIAAAAIVSIAPPVGIAETGLRCADFTPHNSAACVRSSARGGPQCGPLSHEPLLYWAPLSHAWAAVA
jgi:hypothetical protein